jgi:hypothetical protein
MGTAYVPYPIFKLQSQLLLHIQYEVFSLECVRKINSRFCHKHKPETKTFYGNKHWNSDTEFELQLT